MRILNAEAEADAKTVRRSVAVVAPVRIDTTEVAAAAVTRRPSPIVFTTSTSIR